MPCSIRLLPVPISATSFLDFEAYEQLVTAAAGERDASLTVLLGGEAGLRCGEMMALEWTDVNFTKRQLCIQRPERCLVVLVHERANPEQLAGAGPSDKYPRPAFGDAFDLHTPLS